MKKGISFLFVKSNERNKPNWQEVETKCSDEYFPEGYMHLGATFQVCQAHIKTTFLKSVNLYYLKF